MLNCPEFRTLSRICPNLTSRCIKPLKHQAVDQIAVDHFNVFACHRCVLLSSNHITSIFNRGSTLRPGSLWGILRCSLRPPSRMGRAMSPPHTSPPRHLQSLDLGILKSVPNFYHSFMVTLCSHLLQAVIHKRTHSRKNRSTVRCSFDDGLQTKLNH